MVGLSMALFVYLVAWAACPLLSDQRAHVVFCRDLVFAAEGVAQCCSVNRHAATLSPAVLLAVSASACPERASEAVLCLKPG